MEGRGGVTGKILRVDLTTGSIAAEETTPGLISDYLGGRGWGAFYMNREVGPQADPLGPENKLFFMNGPLAGSPIPGTNKVDVTFKSPLTGTYSFALCGGHWGPELKYAGYDGLIVQGAADAPVYLWIDDGSVELKSADRVWGQTIPEADEAIRSELGGDVGLQIAVIGPAGEKLTKYAGITAGWFREFGRGGCGAVMGSKNLKAIAVRGSGDIAFSDTAGVKKLSEILYRKLKEHPKAKARRMYGTPEMVEGINNRGLWCTRNFQEGYFDEGVKLEGPRMRSDIVVGDASCHGCPVGCGKRSLVRTEKFGDILIEEPEFETIGLLGSNCGVSDWGAIARATQICDAHGFDTINAGGCVALAMECYEKGIISLKDTGGIALKFGDGDALVRTVQMIADREGIGNILAEGIQFASKQFGAPELGMHVKGQGMAVYDPRGCKGMGLTYAVSPKGAHHMIATTMGAEISGNTRLSIEGKGMLQREHQFSMCTVDSIGLCATMRFALSVEDQAYAISLVTGVACSAEDLCIAAERIVNLERLYNSRMGFDRKDDVLPRRFLDEAMSAGESRGEMVDLEPMLDEYYLAMGWDNSGLPTPAKLEELGLA